jgi:hypothetical protein
MIGLVVNIQEIINGLVIPTCHHMEEGKAPSSMAGSQDAFLPSPVGILINQTMPVTMKIMYK